MIITSSKSLKGIYTQMCLPNMIEILLQYSLMLLPFSSFRHGGWPFPATTTISLSLKLGIPPFVSDSLFFAKYCPLPVLLFQGINSAERGNTLSANTLLVPVFQIIFFLHKTPGSFGAQEGVLGGGRGTERVCFKMEGNCSRK